MTGPTAAELLADRIADDIVRNGPSPGSAVATRLRVRKSTVLRELRINPRFEQIGHARGSKWRLAGNRIDPPREPLGTDPSAGLGIDLGLDRLAAIESSLAAVLDRLAVVELQLDANGDRRGSTHSPLDDRRRYR